MGMGRGKSEGRRCPRTQEVSHLVRSVMDGVGAGPGGQRPGPGGGGCRHHQLWEALHVLGAELGSPSKSSPGSAVLRAPYPHLPSTVSGPTTDGAQFPKGKAIRPSGPFPEHQLRVGRVSAPAGSGHSGSQAGVSCPTDR